MDRFIKRTGIFLQVRVNSKRMPAKSIYKLSGTPIFQHAMERLNVIPADIRVLLTTKESESFVKDIADVMGWKVFIGDEHNVLKRFVDAALFYKVDTIIRATADNPLVSSEIASETLDLFNKENCDLAFLKPIPYGSGVEVVSTNILIQALNDTNIPYHFEHVTPYIYDHKDKFKIKYNKFHDTDVAREDVRLTVDTRDDFEKMNFLFKNIDKKNINMKIKSIIRVYDELKLKKYRRILFITAFGENYGMGHLKRMLFLIDKLKNEFEIYMTFNNKDKFNKDFYDKNNINIIEYTDLENFINNEGMFDRVITDLRDTSLEEMAFYKNLGPVISFDDTGDGGQLSDLNIKSLPILKDLDNKLNYNFNGLEYLITKTKKDKNKIYLNNTPKKILISFGGSDPSGLTENVSRIFSNLKYEVTIVNGPYFKSKITKIGECNIVDNPDNLEDLIKDNDLVVTSFGITLMDSLILEKPVIIINPTEYHDNLSIVFNYPYLIKKDQEINYEVMSEKITEIINKMINDNVFNSEVESPLSEFYNLKIGRKINNIINTIKIFNPKLPVCPNCCALNDKAVFRTEEYNMYKCKKCDLIYILYFQDYNNVYEENYFIDEYESQYGKTYEEDKKNIIELSKKRIKNINSYIKTGNLLDFGSGLGFFSEFCQNRGFKTLSIDISKFAVKYIKNKLKLEAVQSDQEYLEKTDELFDVITSFYVIEHIEDFKKLLFLFYSHLKINGLLVLSTPNSSGITIKKNFKEYVKKHPKDHYFIFSPKFLKEVLKKIGFKRIKIIITGIHTERFIKSKKLIDNKFINKIIFWYAKLFQLGDTFEIYAQKE